MLDLENFKSTGISAFTYDPKTREIKYEIELTNIDQQELIQNKIIKYCVPANCTIVDPGKNKKGYTQIFDGEKWNYVKDKRGCKCFKIDSDGFFTGEIVIVNTLNFEEENIVFCDEIPKLYKPKFNGSEWIEGETQEKIEELNRKKLIEERKKEILERQAIEELQREGLI